MFYLLRSFQLNAILTTIYASQRHPNQMFLDTFDINVFEYYTLATVLFQEEKT